MRKVATATLAICLLSGCATLDPAYYTRPDSPGYTQQVFHGLCDSCGREFTFSASQFDAQQRGELPATCPYDGHAQDLQMAYNRFNYAVQQAQAQQNAAFAAQAAQIIIQHPARTAQRQANYVQCMNACGAQQRMLGYRSLSAPVDCMNMCLYQ